MRALILPIVLLLACDRLPKEDDTGEDLDSDADTDADADADSDADADTDVEPALVSVDATCADAASTRDVVTCTATGTYDDGSEADVTADADFASSDETVLKFYTPGVGQPLWSGSVDVTVSIGDASTVVSPVTVGEIAVAKAGDLVLNEVLADGSVDGDPNRDGNLDYVEDEFVEIANYADVTVDVSGVTVVEEDFPLLPRHTFEPGTVLRAGEALVVYGGGDVSAMVADNARFFVAENDDVGLQYGLSLVDTGEVVRLVAADGTDITSMAYGTEETPAVEDGSNTLDPDVWGTAYVHHFYATGSSTWFSPGTYADGRAFPGPDGRYAP